ncbi:MAG TPA: glycoside hydrolase family 2 TIM barrel-domain containing protein [Verrucomicrobiae bacterium]
MRKLLHVVTLLSLLTTSTVTAMADSRITAVLNPAWRFQVGDPQPEPIAVNYDASKWELVSLPHSQLLFQTDLTGYARQGRNVGWYRREFQVPPVWLGKRLFIEFQGAMQATTLWVNGSEIGSYAVSGYDSFHFDITPHTKGGRNVLAVKVDNRPSRELPPDGVQADFILFGGLCRDVFLHVTDTLHLTFAWEAREAGVRLTTPRISEKEAVLAAESTVRNDGAKPRKCSLITELREKGGTVLAAMLQEQEIPAGADFTFKQTSPPIARPHLWSPDDPYLYQVHTVLHESGSEIDHVQTAFGFRWVRFDKTNGFLLNGKHLKLVGANRHQTWPFIGNAVPNGLHRRDAEQLKAMGVNWVRLSHYPQDPDFLNALDELGLMAVAEPPTWMEAGGPVWMSNLEKSFRSMIRRDRNHPCIILWAPCINHQRADPALVRAAIEEDPTRDRGQDTVPLPMSFVRRDVPGGGALSIEHTGHKFPAARGARQMSYRVVENHKARVETNVNREYEQAQRHWEQLNAAYQKTDNAGLAVWCMYDYNTFHNTTEPGMVWHGVCDLFRIPKYSYYWHQSELTTTPMAYLVHIDDTHAAVFSNCERITLWQDEGSGYKKLTTRKPETSYPTEKGEVIQYALHHPPFLFSISPGTLALKAEGLVGSAVKATADWRKPGAPAALSLEADRPVITADGADLSRIIVTAVDTNNVPVDTGDLPVTFAAEGEGQLIGENPVNLRAGKMIILAQSGFIPGKIAIKASAPGLTPASVMVETKPVGPDIDMPKVLPSAHPAQNPIRGVAR